VGPAPAPAAATDDLFAPPARLPAEPVGARAAAAPVVTSSAGRLAASGGPVPEVGRNEPCPCGSGKKYKKCHGAGR
jgi:preprotein translocase subunit SecA